MSASVIQLKNVWKTYEMGEIEVNALQGINLDIHRGEFVAITGASGSGKSTMMNLVGCLDVPSKGKVFLDNKDIATMSESDLAQARGEKIGFIFQQFHLIPTLSALENVMLPLEFQNKDPAQAHKTAERLLKLVGLGERMHHLPSQLSGGQQQRVAIARSLANDPPVILGDEPTGNLDSTMGTEVIETLRRLWKDEGKTVIIVTHDMHLASYAKRVVELKDGKVVRGQ